MVFEQKSQHKKPMKISLAGVMSHMTLLAKKGKRRFGIKKVLVYMKYGSQGVLPGSWICGSGLRER